MAKKEFTADDIARSFVVAFLKTAQKEMPLDRIIKTAQTLAENDNFVGPRKEACQPAIITQACKDLAQWNQIALVSHDVYCLTQYMPKYRTVDDTWLS